MNKRSLQPRALPANLPVMAVLGLSEPSDGDWTRLRGLQYATLQSASTARNAVQGTALVASVVLLYSQLHLALILAWIIVVTLTLWRCSRIDRMLADADRRLMSRDEVQSQMVSSLGNGLAWAIPLGCFGVFMDLQTQIKLWTVLAMLMSASAILLPGVPMATLMFTGLVGGSAVVYFLFGASYDMALIAVLFTATAAIGSIEGGKRFLATRIAQAGMAEKEAVVSLLLREFEEGDADWLWQIDTTRRVRSTSPRFAYALGLKADEADGEPFLKLISGDSWQTGHFAPSLHDLANRLKRRESFSGLLVRVKIEGEARWWELSGTPRHDENGNFAGFRGVGSDVTEARENSDKIARLARYDTLTGLPNRMMVTETLGEALQDSRRFRRNCAFLMLDLDRFKAVNDSLGHLVGDQLLARVSERLAEQLGENELCGRLGGDEFAVVIHDAQSSEHVARIADRIIHRLSQPYEIDHHTLFVGASVGSAIGPRDGETVETLMRNADLALYHSKDTGGNIHCTYEPALHANAEERRVLEASLRQALGNDEFALAFQPVVDAESETVVSFEALLRWNNREHGAVSPTKFIPLAEDTRLIVPIGQWVLRRACEEAGRWPGHVRVAVNVSGEQLLDGNFVTGLVSVLAETNLPARRLEIEVTESIFLRDATLAREVLEQVRALGCTIALDDFGTGYSSLGYLKDLRFSTIKVDRSFVQSAANGNPESAAIIRAVVAMAESLDMSTTAEGAETQREVDIIRELGCRRIQGYYFGRPMSTCDIEAMFRNQPRLAGQSAA